MRPTPPCELYIDGACRGNPGPASVGALLKKGDGQELEAFSRYIGEATNNVAEYLALLYGLALASRHGCRSLSVKTDSELLSRQVNGQYKVRDAQLKIFHDLARHWMESFVSCRVSHIPREQNTRADRLAADAFRQAAPAPAS